MSFCTASLASANTMHPATKRLFIFAALITPLLAVAAPSPVRVEVEALLARLQTSDCQFNRNGLWYSGTDASAHLKKKMEYMEGRNMVKTTEDFIIQGASSSSMSGKAYLVRCGKAEAVESKQWLLEQLKTMR
jgi:Family of unknown function (DUF5329)